MDAFVWYWVHISYVKLINVMTIFLSARIFAVSAFMTVPRALIGEEGVNIHPFVF